jgi:hypothetical protein
MSNKLQLRRRISRLLTGEDNFTIKDIIIRRINPATGETMFWGTLRQGRNTENINKHSNHEQDSTPQENH